MEAAAQLEIDQAQMSKLLAGQMAGFSIERLVHFLSLLGQDVEVTVRKAPHGRRRGTVRTRIAKKLDKVAGWPAAVCSKHGVRRGFPVPTGLSLKALWQKLSPKVKSKSV